MEPGSDNEPDLSVRTSCSETLFKIQHINHEKRKIVSYNPHIWNNSWLPRSWPLYKITTSFDFCGAYSRNSLCLYSLSAAVSTPPFTISVQGAKLKVQKGEGGWQHCKQQNAHFCQYVLLHCTLGCFASVDCSWQKGARSVVLSVWYWTIARQWRQRPVNGQWAHSLSSTVIAYVVLSVSSYKH